MASRKIRGGDQLIKQWLVKWRGRGRENTTWEDETLLRNKFTHRNLEGGSDEIPISGPIVEVPVKKPTLWHVYSRMKKVGPSDD